MINMRCINDSCKVCQRWGTEADHSCIFCSSSMITILDDAEKGVTNLTLNSLVIKEAIDERKFVYLTKENFPKLDHVELFWVNVNDLPINENIKSVVLNSCHYVRAEPFQKNDFPYPKAEKLVIRSMITKITKKNRLPMLRALQHLEIRNCAFDDKLSKNNFPALTSLVIEGTSVCKNLKITRLPRLHRVELIDVEGLPPMTNWKGVNMLYPSKVCAFRLRKLVNTEIFPHLAALYVKSTEDVVPQILHPHSKVRKLNIKTSGKIFGVGNLVTRYPMLVELSLDGQMDVEEIPDLPCLKSVRVIPYPLRGIRRKWLKKCQKLELFNGTDIKSDCKLFSKLFT